MAGLYLDTSLLGRVLLVEPDATQIRDVLGRYDAWWSSAILIIELRRLARREDLEAAADQILASVRFTPITDATIERTSRLEPVDVRTLDAIHLDAVIELHRTATIASVLTHDEQLKRGCGHHGIPLDVPS
jgi:predicted nucleic acid-binding protein